MIITIGKYMVPLAVIGLLVLIQNSISNKKYSKMAQNLVPFFLIIYMVISVGIAWSFNDKISLLTFSIKLLKNAEILIVNVLIMAVGVMLTKWLIPLSEHLSSDDVINFTKIKDYFYDYDEICGEWFLRDIWKGYRKFCLGLLIAMYLFSSVFAGFVWTNGKASDFWVVAYPCAALLVINSLYLFLSGKTKEEYIEDIIGEGARFSKFSSFYKLRGIYEKLLPENLVVANTRLDYGYKHDAREKIEKLLYSHDKREYITGLYFKSIYEKERPEIDYIQGCQSLMKGKNVVFFNPFYKDLGKYILLPMMDALIKGKKCLVITGRNSNSEDIINWIGEELRTQSKFETLWRVNVMNEVNSDFEVGVMNFTQICDNEIIKNNTEFFGQTGFVLLIEPSRIINTAQLTMNIIAQEINQGSDEHVYCVFDRKTEGLVDTLSHVLNSEIVEVVAEPKSLAISSGLCWEASGNYKRHIFFDKQTRYLGNGLELAAIALKNQVEHVSIIGETKAPIRDIKWIVGENYNSVCRYVNMPMQQEYIYDRISFSSNIWSEELKDESFIVVEDEFRNFFGMINLFASRGVNHTFVNVISENYLMRDYMRCNKEMFETRPDAIPSIVPDYAKTERNVLLKLVFLMSYRVVKEEEIADELRLANVQFDEPFAKLCELLKKYTYALPVIFKSKIIENYDDLLGFTTFVGYEIERKDFEEHFSESLKNAFYIVEEEESESEYLEGKFFNHIVQTILPGQYLTYDGKYYFVKSITKNKGVVLNRAADLYDERKYYRQIRTYSFAGHSRTVGKTRKSNDLVVSVEQRDFEVNTTGYLELKEPHNLRTAKVVDFSEDASVEEYRRRYRNKAVLKLKLPEADYRTRFTLCILLSELFKTLYPDGCDYLAVTTKLDHEIKGVLNYMVYDSNFDDDEEDDCIYVIEDSEIDLGLIASVEKNLETILQIVADFLDWHHEKMREPEEKDPIPMKEEEVKNEEKRKSLIARMFERIRKLFSFGRTKKIEEPENEPKEPDGVEQPPNEPTDETDKTDKNDTESESRKTDETEETDGAEERKECIEEKGSSDDDDKTVFEIEYESANAVSKRLLKYTRKYNFTYESFEVDESEDPELTHVDGTDIFEEDDSLHEDDMLEAALEGIGLCLIPRTRYQKQCFLKFGFEDIDSRIVTDVVYKYLRVRGFANNDLFIARKGENSYLEEDSKLEESVCCDFCGKWMSDVSYQILDDGRIRCSECAATEIKSEEEFKDIYYKTFEMMKAIFDIKFNVKIGVSMSNAVKTARKAGRNFIPTAGFDVRAVGWARRYGKNYDISLENGAPKIATIETIAHELTHIWQYLNWDMREFKRIYGDDEKKRKYIFEGMATWAAIQYLYSIGDINSAKKSEKSFAARDDEYGIGLRMFMRKYPFVKDSTKFTYTPFKVFPPI